MTTARFRSIWISDTHLGGRDLQNTQLLHFLQSTESEFLYLVGDIFDLWKVRYRWFWPDINNQIIAAIMKKASNGTNVFYVPGNHDDVLRPYSGLNINGISIANEVIHEAADGRKYLVLHGDRFDCVVQHKKWLANVGSIAYDLLLVVNRWYNLSRTGLGLPYHSISASIKHRVKKAVNYIGSFEEALISEARACGADGLICGHIHHAAIRDMGGVLYCNTGDWVESCTALAENASGTIGTIEWHDRLPITAPQPAETCYEDRYRDRRLAPTN